MKKVKQNQMKIVIFTHVKNRCLLHGRVCVMSSLDRSFVMYLTEKTTTTFYMTDLSTVP